MGQSNLLVTFHHSAKGYAENEVRERLKEVGVLVEAIEEAETEGVFEVQVIGEGRRAVAEVKALCRRHPELFQETHHWVPIGRWVPSTEESMVQAARELGSSIKEGERWMLHLHKRHTASHSADLVKALTDPITSGIVDLTSPDVVLVVEIMGDRAGMSLVSAEELLDVNRVRVESGMEKV